MTKHFHKTGNKDDIGNIKDGHAAIGSQTNPNHLMHEIKYSSDIKVCKIQGRFKCSGACLRCREG
jgi:hypothetical protein